MIFAKFSFLALKIRSVNVRKRFFPIVKRRRLILWMLVQVFYRWKEMVHKTALIAIRCQHVLGHLTLQTAGLVDDEDSG